MLRKGRFCALLITWVPTGLGAALCIGPPGPCYWFASSGLSSSSSLGGWVTALYTSAPGPFSTLQGFGAFLLASLQSAFLALIFPWPWLVLPPFLILPTQPGHLLRPKPPLLGGSRLLRTLAAPQLDQHVLGCFSQQANGPTPCSTEVFTAIPSPVPTGWATLWVG